MKTTLSLLALAIGLASQAHAANIPDPTFDGGIIIVNDAKKVSIPYDPTHEPGSVVIVSPDSNKKKLGRVFKKAERIFLGQPGVNMVGATVCDDRGGVEAPNANIPCVVVGTYTEEDQSRLARQYGNPFTLDGIMVTIAVMSGFDGQPAVTVHN